MKAKYDLIGKGYNTTRKADPYLTERMLHHLQPSKQGIYLDIGCGTGNYTHEYWTSGFQFIGVDPSREMLEHAQAKNPQINWQLGTATQTGLLDESVDGITASLTIHHWSSLEEGFAGLAKVLRKNGRMVLFTSTPKQMEGYWLNHYFPKMLEASIKQMPNLENVEAALAKIGWKVDYTEKYDIQPDLEDMFLYVGKNRPEVYFDEAVRRGISSFAALAHQEEVNQGLASLQEDIQSGKIEEIIEAYRNDGGDYLYVVVEKNKRPL